MFELPSVVGVSEERVRVNFTWIVEYLKVLSKVIAAFVKSLSKPNGIGNLSIMFGTSQKEWKRFHGQIWNKTEVKAVGKILCLCTIKAQSIASKWKVMDNAFWDAKGILLIKGERIPWEYYTHLLDEKNYIAKQNNRFRSTNNALQEWNTLFRKSWIRSTEVKCDNTG